MEIAGESRMVRAPLLLSGVGKAGDIAKTDLHEAKVWRKARGMTNVTV